MTRLGIIARIIKYILNLAGITFMVIIALVVSTLVYKYPDCEVVKIKISENIGALLLRYIPFLGAMTGLNFLIERRIERRLNSKEYLQLLCISSLVLIIAVIYTQYDFYTHCRK